MKKSLKHFLLVCGALLISTVAMAKLPAPSDEAKAKAAEAAALAAWTGKSEGYQLCKSQDKVAASYFKSSRSAGKEPKLPTPTTPCAEPGAFAYSPPEAAKPLEASGAHSPATTAAGPPSGKQPDAVLNPAKKP